MVTVLELTQVDWEIPTLRVDFFRWRHFRSDVPNCSSIVENSSLTER